MGVLYSTIRTPVDVSSIDSLIEEAKRLGKLYYEVRNVDSMRAIFSQWITIKTLIQIHLSKTPNESTQLWLVKTHERFLSHRIGSLYTIPESQLETPLLD
jgi:hypothetical protein